MSQMLEILYNQYTPILLYPIQFTAHGSFNNVTLFTTNNGIPIAF